MTTSTPPTPQNDITPAGAPPARQIIFVSGMSGAGMSSVLKNLEDFGFEVFDNIPLFMVDDLIDGATAQPHRNIAFGLDSRTRGFNPADILAKREQLSNRSDLDVSLCFVSCSTDMIKTRYSTTRRPHPLAKELPVAEAINAEFEWLAPLKDKADFTIDTTEMSVHDLKRVLGSRYNIQGYSGKIFITVMSFGFKKAPPREADMVLDVRFLENPHWDKKLRPLSGRDTPVQEFIRKDNAFTPFIQKTEELLDLILPRYEVEGKSYFTLAVGCTGGRHRSVMVAEHLTEYISNMDFSVTLRHRDLQ